MLTNWLTLRAIADELDHRYRGARISGCFSQERDVLMIELETASGIEHLHFSAGPLLFLAPHPGFARARKNSVDVFDDIRGARIESIDIARNDRVVRILLDTGASLLCTLYRRGAGAALRDPDGACIATFKHEGPGETFDFDNTLHAPGQEEFEAALDIDPAREAGHALRALRPYLSGVAAAEVFHRAFIDATRTCGDLRPAERMALAVELGLLLEESAGGRGHVYFRDGAPVHVAPLQLRHLAECRGETADTLCDAVFLFARKTLAAGSEEGLRRRALAALARETARIDRAMTHLAEPREIELRAAEYEKFGNLLMIHMHDYPEQPWRMTVPDIFTDPRLVVSIPIRETETLLENAQRYFEKAKHARSSIAYVRARVSYLQTRASQLQSLALAIEGAESARALKTVFSDHAELMQSLGLTSKGDTDERPFPFRRFVVSGGFEVWAGKNSANNDELTVRHARPNDLWFHARGVGGSHVVLRVPSSGAPVPREAIREAASIAAYYSKHRNAKTVLVAYTEKKYVRKPRGVPAGTVYLEREKTINAEPRLPASADTELEG